MSEFSINLPPRLPNAGPAPNILTAVIPDPPRQLVQLDNGTIIKGQVQGRDPDGLLVVATDKGTIKLSTSANIPAGSQVTMEVRATGDRLQVLVLSVDGQSPGATTSQGPRTGNVPPPATSGGQTPAPPRATGPVPTPAPVAIVGSVLQGTIVQTAPDTLTQLIRSLLPAPPATPIAQPAAQPAAQSTPPQPGAATVLPQGGSSAPAAPSGTIAPAKAAQATLEGSPAGTAVPSAQVPVLPKDLTSSLQAEVRTKIEALFFSTAPTKGGAVAASPTLLSGAPAPSAQGLAQGQVQALAQGLKAIIPLTTGSEVRLRLIAVTAAGNQLPMVPAAVSGAQQAIAGRIIGYTPSGNAVLHSPLGAIILQGHLSVPVGTQLSVAVEPVLPMPGAPLAAGLSPLPQLLLSVARSWPSLAEAIGLLRQTVNEDDALAVLARLPQAGPRLAAGIVAAMQAIRANDAEALLGALVAARSGNAARDESARKVRQEFAQISTLAQERPGTDWRCCFIPVLDDGTIRQINLFYRRDRRKDRKSAKEEKAGTRFIVEVDMSKMGPFQFDGLVREKQFDLMVRSRIALPQKFKHDIIELFQEALSLGDYRGGLVFQKVKEFPVSPLEEIEKSATRVSA